MYTLGDYRDAWRRVADGSWQLIERVKDLDGMWVTTLAEIAGHTASTVQEIHTHARIDVPMFPGAGASFRPAQVRNPEPALNR